MSRRTAKPKRRGVRVALEVILSIAFFGACMFLWSQLRPRVLGTVFRDLLPTATPTAAPEGEAIVPITYSTMSEGIVFKPGRTAIPTPTASPSPTPTPTAVPTKNPAHGDTIRADDDQPIVLDIAIRLMELDYLDFEQPTTAYTEGTADAIRAFQLRNGMEVSGACDPETFSRLFGDDAKTYALVRGFTGDAVALVKERLIELGYLPESDTSDVYGEATENAVRLFRSRNRLPEDVIVDNETFEMLFDENSVGWFFALGDRNDDILKYQKLLFAQGYLCGMPDGVFGKLTKYAVSRFQEENGLVTDGNLNRSVMSLLESKQGVPFVFANGDEGEDVKHLQSRLVRLNYLSSSQTTGRYGDKTEAAVKAFQSRNGLEPTGEADPDTIEKLNDKSAVPNPTPTPKPTKKPTPKPTKTPKPDKTASPSKTKKPTRTLAPGETATPKPTKTPKPSKSPKATATPSSAYKPGGSTISYGEGIEAFIKVAESKLGCRYVSGAKGPDKFDCSGFVYWCLNQVGVKQSYMTSRGWRTCKKYQRIVSMKELRRGDVIVFSGSTSGKGHVGIYLGGGKMIDASSGAGKVRITSSVLTGSYWKEHFLMAYHIWGS